MDAVSDQDFAPETFQEISDEVPSYECLQAELSRVRQEWLLQDSSVPQQQQQSLQLEQRMFELQEQLWQVEEQQQRQLDLFGGQEGREHCHEQTREAPPLLQLCEQPRDEPLPAAAPAPPPVGRDCSASNSGKQGEQFHLQSSLDVEMESKVVSDVLEMGYDPDMVREVVRRHLWEHGRGFSSKLELAHAVLTELMEMLSEALILRSLQSQRSLAREMQSEVVSDLLEMHILGFDPDRVQNAVEQHLWEHGRGFSSKWKLAHAVLDLEEEERIKYEMQSQVVSDVLIMKRGFDPDRVRKAVQQHLREHRRGFSSKWELAHAVLDLEKEEKRLKRMEMLCEGLGTPQVHERDIDPSEQRRLDSFATWPARAPIQPQELAKAGFFYTGSDDQVQCFCCKGILRNWEVGDRAMNKHCRHFPSCQFVQNSNFRNVPIEGHDPKYGDTARGERERLHPHGNFVNGQETTNKPLPPLGQFPAPVTQAAAAPPTPAGRHYTEFLSPAQQDTCRQPPSTAAAPPVPQTGQDINPREQYKSEQRRLDYMERHLYNNSERDMNEHSQHFSSFPFTRNSNVGDVPIEDQDPSLPLSVQQSVPSTPPASQSSGLYQPGTPQVHDIDPGEHYKSEQRRLDSFATWSDGAPIQPRELSKAGFFYTGSDDRVQCFSCQGILRNWEVGDRAMNKHRRHFSSCPFVQNSNVGNVPIEDQDHKYGDTAKGERERLHLHCDFVNGHETRNKPLLPPPGLFPASVPPAAAAPLTPAGRHYTDFQDKSVAVGATAASDLVPGLDYTQEAIRLSSYRNFPDSVPVSASRMARAGFYFSGTGDRVVCFSCGGGVEGWEFGDTAMGEHERLYPHCDFVNGHETRNKPLLPPPGLFPASVPPAAAAALPPAGRDYADFLSPAQQDKLRRKEADLNDNNDSVPVSASRMARAGFYYSGTGDRVVCFSCGGGVEGWEFGDTAMGEHERLYPHCDFVNGRETRNKPLPSTPGLFPASVPQAAAPAGRDYTDFLSPAQQDKLTRKEAGPNLPRSHQSIPASPQASLSSGLYQPGLQPPTYGESGPKHPQMADDCVEGVQAHFPNQQQQHVRPPDEAGAGHDVLEMGFEPNMVRNAVQQHVQDHGRGFASSHDLKGIVTVLHLGEKKEQRMENSGPSQMGTGGFQCHTQKLKEERLENGSDTATGDATYLQDFFYMSERKCKMCMEAEIDIAFIPCGHFTVSVWTYSFHCTMGPGLHTKCANGTVAGFSS